MANMQKISLKINQQLYPSHTPIEYWEFLRWIGIWFLLATVKGYPKKKFWDHSDDNRCFVGAPFTVNDLTTESRFNFITEDVPG